jgi:two-component system, cell cycle sensor histidine kinase and response regulator CckA
MVATAVRVLHVDDSEEEFILLRELLSFVEEVQFEFHWVADIRTAMQAMDEKNFDVCLVDYHLGLDKGLDLIQTALAKDIKMPFILMSGTKDRAIEREALKIGARQCIDKNDITPITLLKAIQDALGN